MWDRRRLGFHEAMPRHYCVKMSVCCDRSLGDTLLLNGANARVQTRGHWGTGGGDWRWYPDIKAADFHIPGLCRFMFMWLFIYLFMVVAFIKEIVMCNLSCRHAARESVICAESEVPI